MKVKNIINVSKMSKKRKDVIDEQLAESMADIFKYDGKKGYSGLDYRKVLEFLHIDSVEFLGKDSEIGRKSVDDDTLELIARSLINLTKSEGAVDEEKETTRGDFVLMVLSNIVAQYYEKRVRLEREFNIVGDDVKGNVEFVVANKKRLIVVIEAKQESWNQGRAQNLMQLYNAYIENVRNNVPIHHTVYGAVTSGYTWEIIWCVGPEKVDNDNKDSKEFAEEVRRKLTWEHKAKFDPIEMNIHKNTKEWKERVAPLAEILSYMIDSCL